MCYAAFVAIHLSGVRSRLCEYHQDRLRRTFVRDWHAERRRRFQIIASMMNFSSGIARDIAEWRTEA